MPIRLLLPRIIAEAKKTSDIISEIVRGIGGAEHTVIEDRAEAIEYAVKTAKSGDIIVLAGKGHEEYEIDFRGKHSFSEKNIAAAAARKYSIEK